MKKIWTAKEASLVKMMRKKKIPYKNIANKIGNISSNAVGMKIRRMMWKGEIKTQKWIHYNDHNFDNVGKEDLFKGILIWWCEGTKPSKGNCAVEFVNSDPILIWHFLSFLRKLNINEKKIKLKLKIGFKEEKKAKKFWCEKLNLPMSSFNKSSRPSGKGIRKGRLRYGTLTVKYSSKKLLCEFVDRWKELMEGELPPNLEKNKYQISWD